MKTFVLCWNYIIFALVFPVSTCINYDGGYLSDISGIPLAPDGWHAGRSLGPAKPDARHAIPPDWWHADRSWIGAGAAGPVGWHAVRNRGHGCDRMGGMRVGPGKNAGPKTPT